MQQGEGEASEKCWWNTVIAFFIVAQHPRLSKQETWTHSDMFCHQDAVCILLCIYTHMNPLCSWSPVHSHVSHQHSDRSLRGTVRLMLMRSNNKKSADLFLIWSHHGCILITSQSEADDRHLSSFPFYTSACPELTHAWVSSVLNLLFTSIHQGRSGRALQWVM